MRPDNRLLYGTAWPDLRSDIRPNLPVRYKVRQLHPIPGPYGWPALSGLCGGLSGGLSGFIRPGPYLESDMGCRPPLAFVTSHPHTPYEIPYETPCKTPYETPYQACDFVRQPEPDYERDSVRDSVRNSNFVRPRTANGARPRTEPRI